MSNINVATAFVSQSLVDSAKLSLVTDNADVSDTYFKGKIQEPRLFSKALNALSTLVGTRFYTPPAMLARILRESDPVVTVNQGIIRFEGFSACLSTYARVDILQAGYHAEKLSKGTTNVDFNAPMRAHLNNVNFDSDVELEVGKELVNITSNDTSVVERKVALPLRWIKGFSEVQLIQSNMTLALTLNKTSAMKFFRDLPVNASNNSAFIAKLGSSIRLSQRQIVNSIKINAIERLKILKPLIQTCEKIAVYCDNTLQTSTWVVFLKDIKITYVLSPEKWRGFSGEGQVLNVIASQKLDHLIPQAKAFLEWNNHITGEQLSQNLNCAISDANALLMKMASSGVLGFDVSEQSYFHRVLPFNDEMLEKVNPRLKSANKLIEQKAVQINESNAVVTNNQVNYVVTWNEQQNYKCTCPWYAKNQNNQGPCKHIVAVNIQRDLDHG